jgi:hypothetical protein
LATREILSRSLRKAHLKAWWQPILDMRIDDPQQEAPYWVGTNNVVLNTPYPGIQIKALAIVGTKEAGVFLSGTRKANVFAIQNQLKRDRPQLLKELPTGTEIRAGHYWPIMLYKDRFKSEQERREWIVKTINTFVNVLRPRPRRWHEEARRF